MLTKYEMISRLSEKSGVSRRYVRDIVETLPDLILEEVKSGKKFRIIGVVDIFMRKRNGRKMFNCKKKEMMDVDSMIVPKFKAGFRLKRELKEMMGGEV